MPMHPGCHCVPVPVSLKMDPGGLINARDLGRFYADAGGTSAEKLRETRYKVDEHGEIGPVLRPHGDPIRTEQQARRDTNRPRPKTPEQAVRTLRNKRDALERSYRRASAGQTDPRVARPARRHGDPPGPAGPADREGWRRTDGQRARSTTGSTAGSRWTPTPGWSPPERSAPRH
jgi:hypothetical protein